MTAEATRSPDAPAASEEESVNRLPGKDVDQVTVGLLILPRCWSLSWASAAGSGPQASLLFSWPSS